MRSHARDEERKSAGKAGRAPAKAALAPLLVGTLGLGLAVAASPLRGQVEGSPPADSVERRDRDAPRVELPRAVQEASVYEVRPGDTLWELARRHLSDPFRWRDIFEANPEVVEDPHWIYPGERLRLPGRADDRAGAPEGPRPAAPAEDVAPDEAVAPAEDVGEGERPTGEGRGQEAGAAPPARPPAAAGPQEPAPGISRFGGRSVFDESPDSGTRLGRLGIDTAERPSPVSPSDYYRAAVLAAEGELGPVASTVRKLEENALGLDLPPSVGLHGRVVLSLKGLRVEPGATLQAFRWGRLVEPFGRVARSLALLEVTAVEGDSARAVVRRVFGDYQVGDPVLAPAPFDFDTSAVRPEPVESGTTGRLVDFVEKQALLGGGEMVFLDLGQRDGVRLGDEFAVFSPSESRPATAPFESRQAVVRVVRTHPGSATARVIDLHEAGVRPGSPVRLVFRAAR